MKLAPVIKFPEILARLIDESSFRTNRRPIWEAVGITSAALSHYTLGRARPRLESLVALADFFNVSLDYLVLGREMPGPVSSDNQSITRYVDWALGDVQTKVARRAWMTARVGQVLADQIDKAIEQVDIGPGGGMMTIEEILTLERYSLETKILSVRMDTDVISLAPGVSAIGRFGHVVAANLCAASPRPYDFLLHELHGRSLVPDVRAFRSLLRDELGVSEERLRFCKFRTTNLPVLIGCSLFRLDMSGLHIHEPALALAAQEYVSNDGWLGHSISANTEAGYRLLLEPGDMSITLRTLKDMWSEATPIE